MNFYHLFLFFFNETATTEIYTLSLHDALPILSELDGRRDGKFGDELPATERPGVAAAVTRAGRRHQRAERVDDKHRHRRHRGQWAHRPRRHIAMQLGRHVAVKRAPYTAEETGLRRIGAALHILADPFSCNV